MTLLPRQFNSSERPSQSAVWEALARTPHPQELEIELRSDHTSKRQSVTLLPPWTYTAPHLLSLAALITPADPSINHVVAQIRSSDPDSSPARLERAYTMLADSYSWPAQPANGHLDRQQTWWQPVTPPWRLLNPEHRVTATCLDISLLLAAILEAVGEKPVVLVENEPSGHAWVGVWKDRGQRFRPLLSPKALRTESGQLTVLETTGICSNRALDFEEAHHQGTTRLEESSSLQGLDVVACRHPFGTLRPIQLGADPVVQALRWTAIQEATKRRAKQREVLHVLNAFTQNESALFTQLVPSKRSRTLARILDQVLPRDDGTEGSPSDTANWNLCWESAQAYARKRGDEVVQEGDVLWAVLESPSKNVRVLLEAASLDLKTLGKGLQKLWDRPNEQTKTRAVPAIPTIEDRP